MSKPKIGTKITPAEAAKLDPAKRGVLVTKPQEADVEGQEIIYALTECPWCGHVGYSYISTNTYNWYTCGNCGGAFRA